MKTSSSLYINGDRVAVRRKHIPCVDHVIVGGSNGAYRSMREEGDADFIGKEISMTAEQILGARENTTIDIGRKAGKGARTMADEKRQDSVQVPDFVQEAEAMMAKEGAAQKRDEVTIKYGKGLAEPFSGKDGKEFMRITIPNQDPSDKTPWASFVLPAKAVHVNQYGKGLWTKIPEDGKTTVTKPTLMGQDETGKNIWQDVKTDVQNTELKTMVEAYKPRAPQEKAAERRESARDKLEALAKETAAKVSIDKPKKAKTKAKGPEL